MLTAHIQGPPTVAQGEPVPVEFQLVNGFEQFVHVLTWNTPLEGLSSDCFRVTHDGSPVRYDGRFAKRGSPTTEDYVLVPPGGSIRATVDLEQAYPLSTPGLYQVHFAARVEFVPAEPGSEVLLRSEDGAGRQQQTVTSEATTLRVEPGLNPRFTLGARDRLVPVKKRADAAGLEGVDQDSGLALQGGTDGQRAALRLAHDRAARLVSSALGALPANSARYARWFGEHTDDRYATVGTVLRAIQTAVQDDVFTYVIEPSGCGSKLAFTTHGARAISVCGRFFAKPGTGMNSQAGILVHELSHCAGYSEDHVYGMKRALEIAVTEPDTAINNADNHEYYCEDVGPQA